MKTLIIPDVHYKVDRVERIIKLEGADRVVFSGDLFDPKGERDGLDRARLTALWFRDNAAKYDFVEGNHDTPYKRGDSLYFGCSGYSDEKAYEICKIVKPEHWERMKRYHWVGKWLISHAGLSYQHLPNDIRLKSVSEGVVNKDELNAWLEKEVEESELRAKAGQQHWVFAVGRSRGGWAQCGGLNWCDYNDEFKMVEGLNQIIGHTFDTYVRVSQNGQNICLDTGLNHYATIIDDKVEIKEYANT